MHVENQETNKSSIMHTAPGTMSCLQLAQQAEEHHRGEFHGDSPSLSVLLRTLRVVHCRGMLILLLRVSLPLAVKETRALRAEPKKLEDRIYCNQWRSQKKKIRRSSLQWCIFLPKDVGWTNHNRACIFFPKCSDQFVPLSPFLLTYATVVIAQFAAHI